ncbi:MAG: alkaline phosphatase [Prevotellaceae bacterium]|jgi:alkaline phosphatase|nr:alkaline phosphatase [Prevotellaceae bacterium]
MNKKLILYLVILLATLQVYAQQPKYVFLFIGDGMGLTQVSAAEAFLSDRDNIIGNKYLSFSYFPVIGLCTTFSADAYVTCSSAAATALASGFKINNGMVNISPSGDTLRPITYKLRDAGYKIGVATTVGINHATPAGFYAASGKRSDYYSIAEQLPHSGFNFFAGGGFISPKGKKEDRADIHEYITNAGYTIVRNWQDATVGKDKIILFQAEDKGDALPTAIQRKPDDLTLPQITEAAIRVLENEQGFFVMLEGGQIDWTCHSNEGVTAVHETIDFAAAVQVAVEFYKKYPKETLIIVTADHETGGMSINDEDDDLPFDFGWTTKGHTGVAVPIYAIGVRSELFGGKMDNTDIPKRICKAMGIND